MCDNCRELVEYHIPGVGWVSMTAGIAIYKERIAKKLTELDVEQFVAMSTHGDRPFLFIKEHIFREMRIREHMTSGPVRYQAHQYLNRCETREVLDLTCHEKL